MANPQASYATRAAALFDSIGRWLSGRVVQKEDK